MKTFLFLLAFAISLHFVWHYLPKGSRKLAKKFAGTHALRVAAIVAVALVILILAFFNQATKIL